VFTRTEKLPYLFDRSILIDNTGHVLWKYDKTRLVPFDEAFVTIAGKGVLPYADTPYGRMSAAICYETYYPALIRQAGEIGADNLSVSAARALTRKERPKTACAWGAGLCPCPKVATARKRKMLMSRLHSGFNVFCGARINPVDSRHACLCVFARRQELPCRQQGKIP
jgi:predicted amidohydrolase